MPIFRLSNKVTFPPPHLARDDGLLAFGGDLSEKRLLLAYRMGIFPWYAEGEPIIWWAPDPRCVLYPEELHVPKRLKRTMKKKKFTFTMDTAFREVITECASVPRPYGEGTWLVTEMIDAYNHLHETGYAHSVETWYEGKLAGGLYGVALGGVFFGESMFTKVDDASKSAFVTLVNLLHTMGFSFIDCQMTTAHVLRFGAREIPRKNFLLELEEALKKPTLRGKWKLFDPLQKDINQQQ